MNVSMDSDVQSVVEFMQSHLPTDKLVAVADCLHDLARSLWSQYDACTRVVPLTLTGDVFTSSQQSTANE